MHETHTISHKKPAFVSKFAPSPLNDEIKGKIEGTESSLQPLPWQHKFTDLESNLFLKAWETKPCAKSKEQRVLFGASLPRPVIKGKIKLSQDCGITCHLLQQMCLTAPLSDMSKVLCPESCPWGWLLHTSSSKHYLCKRQAFFVCQDFKCYLKTKPLHSQCSRPPQAAPLAPALGLESSEIRGQRELVGSHRDLCRAWASRGTSDCGWAIFGPKSLHLYSPAQQGLADWGVFTKLPCILWICPTKILCIAQKKKS